MHLADFVRLAGVVQNALGRSRLTGIDVGHDADIAIVIERGCAGHMKSVSGRGSREAETVAFGSFECVQHVSSDDCRFHQQKRGWTGRPERPVSIRYRRVHSALLPEWGPKARQSPCEKGPSFGRVRDLAQDRLTLNCPALLFGSLSTLASASAGAVPCDCRPISAGAQFAGLSLRHRREKLRTRRQNPVAP